MRVDKQDNLRKHQILLHKNNKKINLIRDASCTCIDLLKIPNIKRKTSKILLK